METEQSKKSFFRRFWWVGAILLILTLIFFGPGLVKKYVKDRSDDAGSYQAESSQDYSKEKPKFEYFPVHFEDFATPAKMYGLWSYGVKGRTSEDHNEGHPGWDFEMKKGSKVYAIADLEIKQIHKGDNSSGGVVPEVIEAYAKLQDGSYHIVYHSVINLEPKVKEGATIKAGEPLAEVGLSLSETSAMIHFGIFPPHDSVGSCPTPYFSSALQKTIQDIVAISINQATSQPFASACVGKISRELYEKNYPDRIKDFGGSEQWE